MSEPDDNPFKSAGALPRIYWEEHQSWTKNDIAFLAVSSYRGDTDEPERNIRMLRVAHRMISTGESILPAIQHIHDHKGILNYRMIVPEVPFQYGLESAVEEFLLDIWEEENEYEISRFSSRGRGYRPSPQYTIPYLCKKSAIYRSPRP